MARKNEELLKKLSALKPSTPTRTRGAKATKGKTSDGQETGSGKKKTVGPAEIRKAKPAVPDVMKRKAASGISATAEGKKPIRPKSSGVKAAGVDKKPEPAEPIRQKTTPDTRVRESGSRSEGMPSAPPGKPDEPSPVQPESPPATDRWNAWKAGFFQAAPTAGWGAFAEASNAACQEASRFRQLWFNGWIRYTRLLMEVADLNWKVMLGFGRPRTGGH
ncbi:MAG: hypothetical protein HPY65_18820 [Syntrophaceae bacterium]|nr:hypothetical protein [Syntrophaceae bacterium]